MTGLRLDTGRLTVRELTLDDLDRVHHIIDVDTRMAERDLAGCRDWLQWTVLGYRQAELLHNLPYGEYGIARNDGGDLVGLVGLVPSTRPFGVLPYYRDRCADYRHDFFFPEVGMFWAVDSAYRRRGYAAEAAAALAGFGLTAWRLRRIIATTEYDNAASIAVMRRIGMRIERNPGTDPPWHQIVGVLDNPAATG